MSARTWILPVILAGLIWPQLVSAQDDGIAPIEIETLPVVPGRVITPVSVIVEQLPTRPDLLVEAWQLGGIQDVRAGSVTRQDGVVQLQLSVDAQQPEKPLSERLQLAAFRPDANTLQGETLYAASESLKLKLSAREQSGGANGDSRIYLNNRVEWQPFENLRWTTQLERSQNAGQESQLLLSTQLQLQLPVLQIAYDWQSANQAGITWQSDKLTASTPQLWIGSAALTFYGRVDRSGLDNERFDQSSVLGGNVVIGLGSPTFRLRYESISHWKRAGTDEATSAQLTFPLFEQSTLNFFYDTYLSSTGQFNQRTAFDLRIQPIQRLQLSAGFEWREGMNWSVGNYGRLSERLNLGVRVNQVELNYSRAFPFPGQAGSDSVSLSFSNPF